MTKNVFEPFDKDVIERGGYVYSTTNKLSAVYSAGKTSQIILKTSNLSGKTVLDVGCGDGTYTNHLWENAGAKSILGIDPAPNSIEVAKKSTLPIIRGFLSKIVMLRIFLNKDGTLTLPFVEGSCIM